MKQRPKRLAALATTVCCGALAMSGCTATGAGTSLGRQTAIVVAFQHELNTLDPAQANNAQTDTVDDTLYDALVQYNKHNELVGKLASAFKVAPDAKSVSFTLRPGLTFHDGSPVTSADVKFSLDRYVKVGQGVASQLAAYKSTTVIDARHFVVNLKSSSPLFVDGLADVYILSQKVLTPHLGADGGQAWLQSHDAGSGPFVSTGGSVASSVTVKRFAKYWAYDAKRPTQITFDRIDASTTEREELQAGSIDVALGLSASDAKAVRGNGINVVSLKTAGQTQIVFNTQSGPSGNRAVRRAVALAFSYAGGLDKLLAGSGSISSGLLSDTLSCRPAGQPASQDVAKATQLLRQAGLSHVKLQLQFQSANAVQTQIATLLQSDLGQIGVTVNLIPVAFPTYLKELGSASTIPQMILINDYAGTPDPAQTLDQLYNSANIGTTNKSAYKNPAVDAVLNEANSTTDRAQRCSLDKKAQELILADAPVASLYQVAFPVAYRQGITGVQSSWSVTPMAFSDIRIG